MKDKKGAPQKIGEYVILKKLYKDSIGTNYRAMEVETQETNLKPIKHRLLTEVYPFLFTTPEEWNRTDVLCQRVQDSGIPNLYAPKKILRDESGTFFVFPFIEGKTLAQIVDDASQKKIYIPFDLAFSISIAIASLIEMGSSLIQGGQNIFHGFLTPDHIIFDYEGNIYLKCFGLWPLLDTNETAVSEMIRMYAAWLTPEFIRREPLSPRSDIYHLGYIVYRMLTGNYFSYLPGEDFQSTFTSISFLSDLPSTDIGYLTSLIDFFKKTLNPDPNKRFPRLKDYKNYVLKYFQTGEFSEFKTNVSTYMKTLYADTIEVEKQELNDELFNPISAVGEENLKTEELLGFGALEVEEKKRSKLQVALIAAAIIVVTIVSGYFIVDQVDKTKKKQQETSRLLEQQNQRIQEFQQKLSTLEVQKKSETIPTPPVTKETEKEVKKDIDKKTTLVTQEKPKTISKAVSETPKETTPDVVRTTKPSETIEKKETSTPTTPKVEVKSAPLVALTETTVKPKQLSGKEPEFPAAIRKAYVGRRATVKADLLLDENGNVAQVELLEKTDIPTDVQVIIIDTLKGWKFTPAQKGDMKVRVKWPVKFKIFFQADL
ncbi:MAG: eukaryotic-like serine/threonine-protein kinase [Acidobacteriota bacterium]|nr:eukaryotic-like serine/threonine-protein kinase [Acidobacteriota bacterium]